MNKEQYEKITGFSKPIWDINDLINDKEVNENVNKICKVRK